MQKTFYHYLGGKRPITIKIGKNFITFHYRDENDREFYDIPISEWIKDRAERQGREDNWHFHMMEKTWFNREMKKYIDDCTKEKIY